MFDLESLCRKNEAWAKRELEKQEKPVSREGEKVSREVVVTNSHKAKTFVF